MTNQRNNTLIADHIVPLADDESSSQVKMEKLEMQKYNYQF